MHIDTVFTSADRDCVLTYPDIVNKIECFSYRPARRKGHSISVRTRTRLTETMREALGLKKVRVVETGGTDYMRERTQWDTDANPVCASPGVVLAYDRNTTQTRCSEKPDRSHHHHRAELGAVAAAPLHDLSHRSGRGRLAAAKVAALGLAAAFAARLRSHLLRRLATE